MADPCVRPVAPGGHPGDHAGGRQHGIEQPGACRERISGQRVGHGAHQPESCEQDDDARGDDQRRVGVDLGRGGDHGHHCGEEPAGGLSVEQGDSDPDATAGQVDGAGGQERQAAHDRTAAERDCERRAHRTPARRH
jgi:hypothetical protein